uniref:NADH dehydrogenase subunit 6 n=2 Tax=unclassified Coloceras TaxID=2629741 RepID=G1EN66_9NEOP|nr:NADH dehydrogenase subunit 6 [Coloceras sp. SLC-2005]AEM23844.1 NADH dehydrogenase subunit 6 [Coloceras sp. SLC-2011]AEM23849.1 NADH dehydrogenase subunit 6 [Coloceras sp. SLC-2011]
MLSFFMGWVLFFFVLISLWNWWFSSSMSVSMFMVLLFSIFSSLCFSFYIGVKVPLYMVVLTLSGGLFVLVSLVVMFFSEDYKKGVTYAKKIFFSSVFLFVLSGVMYFFFWEMGSVEGSVSVWGNFVFLYIFLIMLLFLFLFVVNLIVNPSTGSMFSKKKMSMIH